MSEENTQTSNETGTAQTSNETGTKVEVDYKTKFVESQKEALRLKTELEDLKAQKPPEVPEEEKKIRETLTKIELERISEERKNELQLRKELEDLHTIYGDFDEKKLLGIVDRYKVYGEENKVDWYAAMELYEKIGEVPTEPIKPKVPQSKREGVIPQADVVTPVNISGKSLHQLVDEGLQKFGLK